MKKTTKAMFAFLGLLAFAGCQKENLVAPNGETLCMETTIGYYAAGEYGQAVLTDDESWDLFLDRMFALAREGYEVTIISPFHPQGMSTKEVVTFQTTDQDEAKQWSKEMTQQGYDVTISFDPKTGIYTCTAVN